VLTAHHTVAFLVIAVCALAGVGSLIAWRRGREAGRWVAQVLALAQTLLVAQVALGLLLLADHRRAADRLHYAYGTLALAAVLAPWLYAPREPRRRLAWFGGATLVAAALAVRAYLTAT
jgi:4-amino-4-deoxy-L-arabinose transferase-like glycosyltransferase